MVKSNTKYSEGQLVEYHPVGGEAGVSTSLGTIKRVITEEQVAGSSPHVVHATSSRPSYLIENQHTHKESAVYQEAVIRVVPEEEATSGTATSGGRPAQTMQFSEGQHVEYHPVGGEGGRNISQGVIKKVIVSPEVAGSSPHTVHASASRPSYVIENDHTHKESTVYQEAVIREISE